MVRLPRTARDVLGRVKPPRQILRRGAQFATVAPALTTAERQHIERVLGAGRVALCLVAVATLAWDPTGNGSDGQLPVAMLGGYAVFGVLQLAGASRRRAVRLPSHVSHRFDVAAHYHTGLEDTDLTPRTCRELARTLQGALVNVRKHSPARQVVVRFSADPIHSRLTVDNDERVREPGGELVIESSADRGERLDILLRRRLRARSSNTA